VFLPWFLQIIEFQKTIKATFIPKTTKGLFVFWENLNMWEKMHRIYNLWQPFPTAVSLFQIYASRFTSTFFTQNHTEGKIFEETLNIFS